MKRSLVERLRCPACGAIVTLHDEIGDTEVVFGRLACTACAQSYPVTEGVPRMLHARGEAAAVPTARTSVRFGYLWSQSDAAAPSHQPYHFEKMAATLDLAPPAGLIMDAGCGDGIDLANHARRAGVEIIGVELSDGGCRTSAARVQAFPNAHVVQADLRCLPFADGTFDRVYSYGVLHHVPSPPAAAGELARVSRDGAEIAVYLYEDFGERSAALRGALAVVNSARVVTTRMPPRLLYVLCQVASPVVFLLCTVPYRLMRRLPGLRRLAEAIPFRHGRSPWRLTGDLFDRFSAPIEFRYSRRTAAELLADAGLEILKVGYERGWMVAARQTAGGAGDVSS